MILAKILKRGGNVLILDEPTNDLDLATLRLLEEALSTFRGSVIVVSHDRYFLNRVCTHTLAFEGDGVVTLNAGNYDYYLEKRAARPRCVAAPRSPSPKAAPRPAAEKARKLSYKETRELETIEADIHAAEEKVTHMETALAVARFLHQARPRLGGARGTARSREGARAAALRAVGGAGADQERRRRAPGSTDRVPSSAICRGQR